MSTMLLIKAPDYRGRGAEAVNTLVCHLEGASGIQPYLGPKGQMNPADNVPTDGLAGSDLMVNGAEVPMPSWQSGATASQAPNYPCPSFSVL